MQLLETYRSRLQKTGKQLDWDYAAAAFPYTIQHIGKEGEGGEKYLKLTSTQPKLYTGLLFAMEQKNDSPAIRLTLPPNATHGDRSKGNEFAKFLSKELRAPIIQFNGRVIPA